MFRRTLYPFVLALLLSDPLFAAGEAEASAKGITVFLAASTTNLLEAAADRFEAEQGVEVRMSPASSGTLARQIEQGAQPDLYISASRRWIEYVESLDRIERVAPFARNSLVLVAPEGSALGPFEISQRSKLPNRGRGLIAIADPRHVPAGMYAKSALEYFGWYEEIENRLLPTADVRAALALVELGEVDMGIVYATDAEKSGRVRVIATFPEVSHPPIQYYCALLDTASGPAAQFYDYLLRDQAVRDVMRAQGFSAVE